MKPLWQNVEQEAPDELLGAERHCAIPRLPVAAVVLVPEGHAALVESNEPAVCDGDAMSVAGEIGKYRFRPGEGRLGVDKPVLALERREMRREGLTTTEVFDLAKEREAACRMGAGERLQEEPPEQAGKHSHRQQKAGLAAHPMCPVEGYPATRHDHVDVRVMGHRRSPGVEHRSSADASAEVLGIGRDREQRLGSRAEQQVVDYCLVLVGDRSDLGGQREDHVEIGDRQQICPACRKPIRRRRALTLWAMAIATRVVSDAAVAAIFAALDMATERGGAALLDCRHDLELTEAHMSGIGAAPVGSM